MYYKNTQGAGIVQSVEQLATGWMTEGSKFQSWYGQEFSFSTSSRPNLRPTQLPILWMSGALSQEVKQPGSEADHSPPTSSEVKKTWIHISTPPIYLHGIVFN
jgi:hypothetical protein